MTLSTTRPRSRRENSVVLGFGTMRPPRRLAARELASELVLNESRHLHRRTTHLSYSAWCGDCRSPPPDAVAAADVVETAVAYNRDACHRLGILRPVASLHHEVVAVAAPGAGLRSAGVTEPQPGAADQVLTDERQRLLPVPVAVDHVVVIHPLAHAVVLRRRTCDSMNGIR